MTPRFVWPAGRPFTRAHSHQFGSTEFDARTGVEARFSPLYVTDELTPVLYAGVDDRTAAAETIFRRLPHGGRPRRIWLDRYRAWHWSQIHARRDLHLLALDARLDNADVLVDGDAATYHTTRAEAAKLLRADGDLDGVIWVSRQLHDHPSSLTIEAGTPDVCLLLVGPAPTRSGGVAREDLTADRPVTAFATTAGTERLDLIAEQLDITVMRS